MRGTRHGGIETNVLDGNPKGKRPKTLCRWQDNVKINAEGIWW